MWRELAIDGEAVEDRGNVEEPRLEGVSIEPTHSKRVGKVSFVEDVAVMGTEMPAEQQTTWTKISKGGVRGVSEEALKVGIKDTDFMSGSESDDGLEDLQSFPTIGALVGGGSHKYGAGTGRFDFFLGKYSKSSHSETLEGRSSRHGKHFKDIDMGRTWSFRKSLKEFFTRNSTLNPQYLHLGDNATTAHPASATILPQPVPGLVARTSSSLSSKSEKLGPVKRITSFRLSEGGGSSDSPQMPDICLLLQDCNSARRFLGMLSMNGSSRKYKVSSVPLGGCLGVTITHDGSSISLSQPVSLQTLLQRGQTAGWTQSERLLIAIKLASSVIQLHHTWFQSGEWSKHDILFFSNPQTNQLLKQKPIVLHDLASKPTQDKPDLLRTQSTFRGVKARPLFLLGLVLWELWYGKCLEEWGNIYTSDAPIKDDQDSDQQVPGQFPTGDYLQWSDPMLLQLADLAYEFMTTDGDAPTCYTGAVQMCLFGGIRLKDEGITTAWEKVVWPLENMHETLKGIGFR